MSHLINWLLLNVLSYLHAYLYLDEQVDMVLLLVIFNISAGAFLLFLFSSPDKSIQKERRIKLPYDLILAATILLSFVLNTYIIGIISVAPILFYFQQKKTYYLLIFPALLLEWYAQQSISTWILFLTLILLAIWLSSLSRSYQKAYNRYIETTDKAKTDITLLKRRNQQEAESYTVARRNAVLQERNRIAREIHDNVGHRLTSAILQVSALELVSDQPAALGQIHTTLEEAMEDVRTSVHAIHADSLSIREEIEQIAKDFRFCPVYASVAIDQQPSQESHYAIILIIREALVNVAKHSNATRVTISLKQWGKFHHLIIADNGTVNEGKLKNDGMGLLSMEERVQTLGGSLHINQENGYHIFIRIPLAKEDIA